MLSVLKCITSITIIYFVYQVALKYVRKSNNLDYINIVSQLIVIHFKTCLFSHT